MCVCVCVCACVRACVCVYLLLLNFFQLSVTDVFFICTDLRLRDLRFAIVYELRTESAMATGCRNPLDLVFLVDDSSSIRGTEWPTVLSFLQSVLLRLTIDPVDDTRVGVVRYSDNADVIYRFSSTQTLSAVQNAIGRMQHLGGSTNLAEALYKAYEQIYVPSPREGAARVT